MEKGLKKQYNKVKKMSQNFHDEVSKFNRMMDDEWGFSFSDFDYDEAIDTLDYGTSDLDFETFVKEMNEEKEDRKKQEDSA